ncbi:hypothetical protein V8E36_003940 [Tilletia maclaganii]
MVDLAGTMRKVVRTANEEDAKLFERSAASALKARTAHSTGDDLVRRQANTATQAACRAGALYVSPKENDSLDSANEVNIQWNKDCLEGQGNIDIYIVSAIAPVPFFGKRGIPSNLGSLSVQLHPYWWNSTSSVRLSVNIVKAGNQVWDSPNPVGPVWTATYAVPGPGQPIPKFADPSNSKIDAIVSYFYVGGGLTSGGKAAAIICPLVVVLTGVGLYIRKKHINRFNKTADWANKMDQRMSRISVDWDRGGDGSAGAVPGTRPASYFQRPSQDIYGASQLGHRTRHSQTGRPEEQEMDEIDPAIRDAYLAGASSLGHNGFADNMASRTSFGTSNRQSRISFAPAPESTDGHSSGIRHRASASLPRVGQNNWRRSLGGGGASGLRNSIVDGGASGLRNSVVDGGADDVPEVPKLSMKLKSSPLAGEAHDADDFLMSPTQHDGPRALAQTDVDLMRPSFDSIGLAYTQQPPLAGTMNRQTMDSTLSHGYFAGRAGVGASAGAGVGASGGLGRLTLANQTSGEFDRSDSFSMSTGAHLPYTSTSPPPQLPSLPNLTGSSSLNNLPISNGNGNGGAAMQTGMAPPSNAKSPDDAMRAYAAGRGGPPTPGSGPGGMRTLFAGGGLDDDSAHRASPSVGGGSMGGSSLNEDDVVGYNEAAAAGR